jgi:hypothetical protein
MGMPNWWCASAIATKATTHKAKLSQVGSIDCAPIREAITLVMEGGRDAFELRKNKYGF